MRRILPIALFVLAGCSSAPVADFLDAVAPGGARPDPRHDAGPTSGPREPFDNLPPAEPRRKDRDNPPPLPPVPTGHVIPPIEGDEGEPSARLRPRPVRPGD